MQISHDTFCRVIAALVEGPCSIPEIIEATGLHRETMYRLIRTMKRHKLVHVCAWDKDVRGRITLRVYAWGDGPDKRRPKVPRVEVTRRYRERKRQKALNSGLAGVA